MKRRAFALTLVAVLGGCGTLAPAVAGVAMVAHEPGGAARFDIYDDGGGLCVGDARLAVYVPKDGKSVRGCWTPHGSGVRILFLDGDMAQIPASALKKPEEV